MAHLITLGVFFIVLDLDFLSVFGCIRVIVVIPDVDIVKIQLIRLLSVVRSKEKVLTIQVCLLWQV